MTTELKPCPKCHQTMEVLPLSSHKAHWAKCSFCDHLAHNFSFQSYTDAVTAWNNDLTPPEPCDPEAPELLPCEHEPRPVKNHGLSDCPYCGSPVGCDEYPAHRHAIVGFPDHHGSFVAECPKCPAGMIADTLDELRAAWNRRAAPPAPERKPLNCPECGKPHVDRGEWATKPHHTHLCEHCGHKWRVEPYTFGVEAPAQSDRERAEAFIPALEDAIHANHAGELDRDVAVPLLAAEFAAVGGDATKAERERVLALVKSVRGKTFDEVVMAGLEVAIRGEGGAMPPVTGG